MRWLRNYLQPVAELRVIGSILSHILKELRMLSPAVKALQGQVAAQDTVIKSATTMILGFADIIMAAKDDPPQIEAIAKHIKQTTADLAAAVATIPAVVNESTPPDPGAEAGPGSGPGV